MKKSFLLAILLCVTVKIKTQTVKTGKDESSIFSKTTNIGFDVGESELSFNFNNYSNSIARQSGCLYGVNAKGKNSEGLSGIFDSGDISPESSLSGLVGIFFSNANGIRPNVRNNKSNTTSIRLRNAINQKFSEVIAASQMSNAEKTTFDNRRTAAWAAAINNIAVLVTALRNDINDQNLSIDYKQAALLVLEFIESSQDYRFIIDVQNNILSDSEAIEEDLTIVGNTAYIKHMFYAHFGLNSQKFTLFRGWDTTKLSNSFEDINFNGGQGGLGYNLRVGGHWLFGLKYTYKEGNNFDNLGSLKYSYSNTQSMKTESYASKKDIVAKTGNYSKIYLQQFNLDLCYFLALEPENYAVIDLYCKGSRSNRDSLYASRMDLGIAASLYRQNSNFIGGIYLELPDVDQNAEKQKETPNLRPWQKRLSFGVYGKINLYSLPDIRSIF